MIRFVHLLTSAFFIATLSIHLSSAEISGVTVTPHVVADSMMYRRPRDPDLAAKVQLFVKGTGLPKSFNGKTPSELLESGDWAWHDLGTAVQLPENSLRFRALKRFRFASSPVKTLPKSSLAFRFSLGEVSWNPDSPWGRLKSFLIFYDFERMSLVP
ncbi:MAG: hypothetical protein KGQ60_08010 [Planctomycetes bacterium]|nr:hypothetical protein [Planctomycetota bacterium]